jgi:uncharacterized protein (TIGR03437 family)
MRATSCLLALLLFSLTPVWAEDGGSSLAPTYSAASIVNSATNLYGTLAPNTIATLYGENLAYSIRAITADDILNGLLPTVLAGTGTRVLVNGMPAHLYYVSPNQINFLIPSNLLPGPVNLRLVRDGRYGPEVRLQLHSSDPALYQLSAGIAIAMRPDGSVATEEDSAHPGDMLILYATGLGQTEPRTAPGEIVRLAAPIQNDGEFQLTLDNRLVPPESVFYVGLTPGFAGLYQVNLRLPPETGDRPEIRIGIRDDISPPGVRLPVFR